MSSVKIQFARELEHGSGVVRLRTKATGEVEVLTLEGCLMGPCKSVCFSPKKRKKSGAKLGGVRGPNYDVDFTRLEKRRGTSLRRAGIGNLCTIWKRVDLVAFSARRCDIALSTTGLAARAIRGRDL